ncbi:MAG TPA: DUF309 domain-containing protein [Candidatus Acidoferrales bacterium]|nr:DUF309 domain-containing protein [Candidatus Acidoferrales bacterium]HXY51346.1 DUF309 domain-containing protein [Terriglobales bacterium]
MFNDCESFWPHYEHGIALFNRADFFAAHEELEQVWRAAPPAERRFLQGLIQVAVALHHHSTGNLAGCRSVLGRACRNLAAYPSKHGGLDLAALLAALAHWRLALDENRTPPPPPVLSLHKQEGSAPG